mmetsp:Transcript_92782/g.155775  ORF Transcript_92782/g.155775 Transcript_92782/m.155775 type:complete len:82 (+) Transcript_92782:1693-1938(+)
MCSAGLCMQLLIFVTVPNGPRRLCWHYSRHMRLHVEPNVQATSPSECSEPLSRHSGCTWSMVVVYKPNRPHTRDRYSIRHC